MEDMTKEELIEVINDLNKRLNNIEAAENTVEKTATSQKEETRDQYLSMLKELDITEDEYYEDAWNSVQKQRSLAVLLAESFQTVKSFSRDIGYRNFNDIRDVAEAKEIFSLWNKISKRKRRMSIVQRLTR